MPKSSSSSLSSVEHDGIQERFGCFVCRFHEKVLDCCDLVVEEMLVDVCLYCMTENFLENSSFPSFYKLMEAAHRTNSVNNLEVQFSTKSNPMIRPASRKRPMVMTLEKCKGARLLARRSQSMARESLGITPSCHYSLLA